MADYCIKCGKLLTDDEIGLHRKLVSRAATQFACIDCLSRHFKIDRDELRRRIEQWRRDGCTLFN